MTYFEERAETETDLTKREQFKIAANAEEKGYNAKVVPGAVIITNPAGKLFYSEFKTYLPTAARYPFRRTSGNGYRVQVA
jgi:hypothetical protein